MAFVKGKSGNPRGRVVEKVFTDMLKIAVNEIDSGTGNKKLRVIADKLVGEAMKGESWAVMQVADRLEGKPAQTLDATINDERDLSELSTSELLARAARILETAESGDRGSGEGENKSSDVRKLN